jgi:NADH-quinone oxidoreductase subunit M
MEWPFPWLAVATLVPILGACWVRTLDDPLQARRHSLLVNLITLIVALGGAIAFLIAPAAGAAPWNLFTRWLGEPAFAYDDINLPLIPLAALLYVLTSLASLHTRGQRFAYDRMLVSESLLLATLSCQHAWLLVGLLAAQAWLPWLELRALNRSTRVYSLHMGLCIVCLAAGQAIMTFHPAENDLPATGTALLAIGALIRCGVVPLHCWLPDLFENAALRSTLLFVTPMTGAYALVRLVLPVAPDWIMGGMLILAALTAIYSAGMALVQKDARRFFCYLFLSHSSLVLVGLGMSTPLAVAGALWIWFSVGLSLTGFGLTLRAVEARIGPLSLVEYNGLYDQFPRLAMLFLLTALASIGFPGTVGFVGNELLVDGAIHHFPLMGIAIVISTALNGLAVMHVYFRLFTGKRRTVIAELRSNILERAAILLLIGLIIGGGLYPQLAVQSRFDAAVELVQRRAAFNSSPSADAPHPGAKERSAALPSSP